MNTTNLLKTGLLLGALTALFLFTGSIIGGTPGMVVALLFAIGMNGVAYWFSDRLALRMAHARPLSAVEAPGLYALVQDLAAHARLPVPAIYLIDDPSPNAFATGRNPSHAALAVTSGLLHLLDPPELRGVLAHEFAHIKHRDILLTSLAATIGGGITALANIFQFGMLFGQHDEEDRGGWAGTLVLVLVAPIAAAVIQFAVSRSREYAADAEGARLCGEPLALASALRRLQRGTWLQPLAVNPAAAPLFIVQPFAGVGVARLFSTHPPVEEHIARLERMAILQRQAAAGVR